MEEENPDYDPTSQDTSGTNPRASLTRVRTQDEITELLRQRTLELDRVMEKELQDQKSQDPTDPSSKEE